MKQLLTILLFFSFFISCSSDDDETSQGYTSFTVTVDASPNFPNCVAAYKKDNKYYKLGDLGDLTKGKISPEITIKDNTITEVYIFSDYMNVIRFDAIYQLSKNKKNSIVVENGTGGIKITDKNNQEEYPQ